MKNNPSIEGQTWLDKLLHRVGCQNWACMHLIWCISGHKWRRHSSWLQEPVSRKSRNFTGHFWVSQFPLHLVKLLRFFFFLLPKKRSALQNKRLALQFHKWLFEPETFSGLSRNGPQERVLGANHYMIKCISKANEIPDNSCTFKHLSCGDFQRFLDHNPFDTF